jgi:Ca2+-binding EF-hand superfamily protein
MALNNEIEHLNAQRKKFSKAGKNSDSIVQQTRKSKINEIFDLLDSDKDGEISSNKIDVSFMK